MRDFVRASRRALAASGLLAIAGTAAGLVPFLSVYWIAEAAIDGALTADSLTLPIAASFLAILAKVVLNMAASALSHRAAYQVLYLLRCALIEKLSQVSLGFFALRSVGALKKTINEDVEELEEALAHAIPDAASAIAVPLAVGVFLAFVDWRLALAALALFPLLVMIYPLSLIMAKAEMDGYHSALAALRAATIEFLQGMKVIRAFLGAQGAVDKFDAAVDGMADASWRMATAAVVPSALMMVGLRANVLALLPIGGFLFLAGEVSANAFVLFLLLGMGVNASVYKLLYTAGSFAMRMATAGKKIQEILGAEPLPQPRNPKRPAGHDLAFQNVSFTYGETEPERGLRDVTFSAPEGSFTAVVGPSGGGKTTLARLIGRFWDVDQGAVRLGGVDLRDMESSVLTGGISFILQDAWLLNTSIRENIRSGRPEADDAAVVEAARKARVLDFTEELEGGLDAGVGEGGRQLSGGQRQRVAIARAILRAAPVVVMDEATSALDPDNEAQVLEALRELAEGRTVVAIAHRLDTIRSADNILFMQDGRLEDQGPHEELLERCEAYARLYESYSAAGNWRLEKTDADVELLAPPAAVGAETDQAPGAEATISPRGGALGLFLKLAGPMRGLLLKRAVPLLVLEALLMGAPVVATLLALLDVTGGTLTAERVWSYTGLVAAFFAAQVIAYIFAHRALWKVQSGAASALQHRLGRQLRQVPLGELESRDTGVLETLITQHTTGLNFVMPTTQMVRAVIAPAVSLAFMFFLDWRLALAAVASLPAFLAAVALGSRISRQVWVDMFASREALSARVIEYLQGIATLRSLGLDGGKREALNKAVRDHRDVSLATVTRISPVMTLGLSVLDLGFCAVLLAGGVLTVQGAMAFPIYLIFMVIGLVFYGPIADAFELALYRHQQERSMARISDVLQLNLLPEPSAPKSPKGIAIEFDGVSFAYRSRKVLEGIDLVLPAGGLYAFVGPSGSGKTTALNLLARFWDVGQGAIRIGGADLRELARAERNGLFAVVFQDTFLFNDSIAANLRLARPGVTDEDVIAAAKAACCHDFIMALDEGYDTEVGDAGGRLSGGQRQRLAIARAILKNAPIVLLDEATASIDPENEHEIRTAMGSLCAGRTVIVVAHRLSSIVQADQIAVFDRGGLAGLGTHQQLLEGCATYRKLWRAQCGAQDSPQSGRQAAPQPERAAE